MDEETFLDPMRDGELLIRDVESELDDVACACRSLGMATLADRLSHMLDDLSRARVLTAKGRDMALKAYVGAADHGSRVMMETAIAADSLYTINK